MLSIANEQTQSLSDIGLSWLPEFQPGIPDQFQPYKWGWYLLFARTVDKHSFVKCRWRFMNKREDQGIVSAYLAMWGT